MYTAKEKWFDFRLVLFVVTSPNRNPQCEYKAQNLIKSNDSCTEMDTKIRIRTLTNVLRKMKQEIACSQEIKWKEAHARECNGYKLWYVVIKNARNGVGVFLTTQLKENIIQVKRCSIKIMGIKVVVGEEVVNVRLEE